MIHLVRLLILPAAALALAMPVLAGDPRPAAEVRAEIAKRLEIRVDDVQPSPIPGLYEVRSGAEVAYVSTDGRFYLDGDIFDMTSRKNLTERRREESRVGLLASVPDGDAIVFAPAGPVRHTVTVFTDVDCPHCRRMHKDIAELNRLGIRVRYLLFPLDGPGSEAWRKAEAVWCSADRRDALTRAKRGEAVQSPQCESPVSAHFEMARRLGIRGTPGVITDSGAYLAGYPSSAAQLAEYLAGPPAQAASN